MFSITDKRKRKKKKSHLSVTSTISGTVLFSPVSFRLACEMFHSIALWDLSAERRHFSIAITFVSQRSNVNIQDIVSCKSEEKPCADSSRVLEWYYWVCWATSHPCTSWVSTLSRGQRHVTCHPAATLKESYWKLEASLSRDLFF